MNLEKVLDDLFRCDWVEKNSKGYYFEFIILNDITKEIKDLWLLDDNYLVSPDDAYDVQNETVISHEELLDRIFDIRNKIKKEIC